MALTSSGRVLYYFITPSSFVGVVSGGPYIFGRVLYFFISPSSFEGEVPGGTIHFRGGYCIYLLPHLVLRRRFKVALRFSGRVLYFFITPSSFEGVVPGGAEHAED